MRKKLIYSHKTFCVLFKFNTKLLNVATIFFRHEINKYIPIQLFGQRPPRSQTRPGQVSIPCVSLLQPRVISS